MEIKSFTEYPTTEQIRQALVAKYGNGEIDNDGFHTEDNLTHVYYHVKRVNTGYIFDLFEWSLEITHVSTIPD